MAASEEDTGPASQPRPPSPDGDGDGAVHYLAKCIVKGSAVLHAVQGHFRSPSSLDVVLGKETSLELAMVSEDGVVQSIFEQSIFGIIKDLAILQWNDRLSQHMPQAQGRDLLVVLSDSGKLSFLAFSSEMHRFFAVTHIDLSTPGNSRHELGRMLAVDPEGCFIAVGSYEDRFALFSVSMTSESSIIDEKLFYPPENEDNTGSMMGASTPSIRGTIWSMCFVSSGADQLTEESCYPVLAIILHRKGYATNDLLLFGCNHRTRIIHLMSQYSEAGPLALAISAIPHFSGFALIFRAGDVLLMDLRDAKNVSCVHRISLCAPNVIEEQNAVVESSRGLDVDDEGMFNVAACALLELRDSGDQIEKDDDPMNIDSGNGGVLESRVICSWCWEPTMKTHSKLIFCLDTGEYFLMEINFEMEGVKVNLSECLYKNLPCKSLLWTTGIIAGFVEMGDGMVLKLEDSRLLFKSTIQNIAPILDFTVADYQEEKQDHMFACCGMNPYGSLSIIRSGISVEKLLKTASIYQGVTGTWALRMKEADVYHSFLVLSFVEETRILSVGLSFNDVSDGVGFQTDVCTLACGLVADGLLVQIHRGGVRLCMPTSFAHPEGVPLSVPICTSWCPHKVTISVGAVGHNLVILATSNPCFLFILGVRSLSAYHYELYEIQNVRMHHEVSCVAIPQKYVNCDPIASDFKVGGSDYGANPLTKFVVSKIVVVGTHKPSVEVLSLVPGEAFRVLAIGLISVNDELGCPLTGCIPEAVRLVSIDRSYILSGLRNGMLLRFEWPTQSEFSQTGQSKENHFAIYCSEELDKSLLSAKASYPVGKRAEKSMPAILQLIAVRRVGVTPVVLVPLCDLPNGDIIVLSDRPWLLHAARHSLVYSSISFQSASHVTPVCSADSPKGILFVAESCLHLVEMIHSMRLNVHKLWIQGTPRKVLYHQQSRTLLVMRTGGHSPCSSDICRVDPLSGSLLANFVFGPGETAKCMQLMKVGADDVLIVGTSRCVGRTILPSGEAESVKGRMYILSLENAQSSSENSPLTYCSGLDSPSKIGSPFREFLGYATEQLFGSSLCNSPDDLCCDRNQLEVASGHMRSVSQTTLSGAVLSICPYRDRYILASAGNTLNVFCFVNENPHRLKKLATSKTRFTITCLKTHSSRIVVGDCRDGVLFYSYNEVLRKLELIYSDPAQRLVADCALVDSSTAVVSDRRGSIAVLSCPKSLEVCDSPEKNLIISCSFYMGETAMSIQKASFLYKLPVHDVLNGCQLESDYDSVVASTLLGSVFIMIPLTSEEYQLLEAVQDRLAIHPLTSPVLGNNHKEFRGRGKPAGVPSILDGDMLVQFLELTNQQQEAVLATYVMPSARTSPSGSQRTLSVTEVVRTLERVHYALS